jgi:malate dehydrogenase (oxaloacetate-decarboxylating)(NADP+)
MSECRTNAGEGARGIAILRDPARNRGTAFSEGERDVLGLRGLLPPRVSTQEEQIERVLENFHRVTNDLDKYRGLAALLNRNEALFFRVVMEHPDEMTPIIYTPTVGLACQQFGHIFERPRGLFVSSRDRGRVAKVLRNWPYRDVRIIVVSDGERILGLGDLGANGMGIPVGKLALYTACAGVPPTQCLPVMLDVGTENQGLLDDPLYVGLHERRLRGADYDALVEEFVCATQDVFPGVLVQFEDFATAHAFRLLERYRGRLPAFNDDIQGTAAVVLAGLRSALRVQKRRLSDQRILCFGAGEAASGICQLLVTAMRAEGLSEGEARSRCWLFNSRGLVVAERADLGPHQRDFAHPHAPVSGFLAALEALKPTAILGAAGVAHVFDQAILERMSELNERPIVFALSNPTSRSECSAAEAYQWSAGRALFASGSPFRETVVEGLRFVPRQANNSYVFPGLGLGAILCRARQVSDGMFSAAADALAGTVTEADLAQGSLFPPLSAVREISVRIACAVMEVAWRDGLATIERPADLEGFVRSRMYDPRY